MCHLRTCVVKLLLALLNNCLSIHDFRNCLVVLSPNIACNGPGFLLPQSGTGRADIPARTAAEPAPALSRGKVNKDDIMVMLLGGTCPGSSGIR